MATLPPNLLNSYVVTRGENLPNHSTSLSGRGKFVGVSVYPIQVRTAQEAFKLAAWLVAMTEDYLPDEEDDERSFEEVLEKVRESKHK
jgi:hypothetical protein